MRRYVQFVVWENSVTASARGFGVSARGGGALQAFRVVLFLFFVVMLAFLVDVAAVFRMPGGSARGCGQPKNER